MQIKILHKIIIALVILSLASCNKSDIESNTTDNTEASPNSNESFAKNESVRVNNETSIESFTEIKSIGDETDDILVGQWVIGGVFTDNKLIDISSVDALKDLYDGVYLTISADGSFVMLNGIFVGEGNWENIDTSEYEHAYLLSEHQSYRYTFENGKLEETQHKDSSKKYTMCITNEDVNSALVMDNTEDDKDLNSHIKVWVRESSESKYLSLYSTTIGKKQMENSSDHETSNPSKETEYSRKETYTNISSGQRNALEKAHDYLNNIPFSSKGLKEQLEYEGFSSSDSQYAVDHCGADWNKQAVLKAQNYLDTMSFSKSGLIDQLEYDGFTHQEAVYGVEQTY